MVNKDAYGKLVNEDCKKQHDNVGENTWMFTWFEPCREINLWTYWQGKASRNVKIMVVGQDWGNPYHPKNYQRKNVIGNLSLKKRYNRIFRLNRCL